MKIKYCLVVFLMCILLTLCIGIYNKSQETKPFFQIIDNGETFTLIHE